MLRVVCPECEGAKQVFDVAGELGCGCYLGRKICSVCHGVGEVTFELAERWREAHGMQFDAARAVC